MLDLGSSFPTTSWSSAAASSAVNRRSADLTSTRPALLRSRAIARGGSDRVRDGDLHLGRQVVEEELHDLVHGSRRDLVVVVEGDDGALGQQVEVVDEGGQHPLEVGLPRCLDGRLGVPAELGSRPLEGSEQVGQEPLHVVVVRVE